MYSFPCLCLPATNIQETNTTQYPNCTAGMADVSSFYFNFIPPAGKYFGNHAVHCNTSMIHVYNIITVHIFFFFFLK